MKVDFSPAHVEIFKEFGLSNGELKLSITNDGREPMFVYRNGIVKDSLGYPVARGVLHFKGLSDELDCVKVAPGVMDGGIIVISADFTRELVANQDYEFIFQVEREPHFSWSTAILENLDSFVRKDNVSSIVELATRVRPADLMRVPFYVRSLMSEESLDLCIDFGTSFSSCAISVGSSMAEKLACYKSNEPWEPLRYTLFTDADKNHVPMLPTTMFLETYDHDNPRWLFGYEANEKSKESGGKGTYLTGIKRFLSSLDDTERCRDMRGRGGEFSHQQILEAYIGHIVSSSKKYFGVDFKSVHVSTPVLYADRQRTAFEHILKRLDLKEVNTRLDEARAPLYHFLAHRVEKASRNETQESRLEGKSLGYLIIDCGGGSTDATLLRRIKLSPPKRQGGAISLESSEPIVGGNNSFGGEDLTDYIFNYIKIKLSDLLFTKNQKTDYLIDEIIDMKSDDIFYNLHRIEKEIAAEKQDLKSVVPSQLTLAYGEFRKRSQEAERLIPTNEDEYRERNQDTWQKVNNNKVFIWQLAESLKRRCYADGSPKKIDITDLQEWSRYFNELWSMEDGNFVNVKPLIGVGNVVFHNYEIDKLLQPVIFAEVSRLVRDLEIQEELVDDKSSLLYVRFVGQSTRIPIFTDALAYFLPQRIIEEEKRGYCGQSQNLSRFVTLPPDEKKLCSVAGAAKFHNHVATGKIRDTSFVATTRILRDICRLDDSGQLFANDPIIARNTPVAEAEGAFLRSLSSVMVEYFGTTQDENTTQDGWITIKKSDLSRVVEKGEIESVSKRWDEFLRSLKDSVEEGDPLVLIVLKVIESKSSQKYEFAPYIWDNERGEYLSTEAPVELQYRREM